MKSKDETEAEQIVRLKGYADAMDGSDIKNDYLYPYLNTKYLSGYRDGLKDKSYGKGADL